MTRSLTGIADAGGAIRVLAIDHRDSLEVLLDAASHREIVQLKSALVAEAGGIVSGVMLDPTYGLQSEVLGKVPAGVGVIAALEAQGYLNDASVTHTTLGSEAAQVRAVGATAAKFLALWDGEPDSRQRDTIADARRSAHDAGLPLVLEPLPRGLDPFGSWVLDWCEEHADSGADLFKLPYPGSAANCEAATAALPAPWAILSAGVDFETFVAQAESADRAGASGYIVGRAVWREAATVDTAARSQAIADLVVPRLRQLASIPFDTQQQTTRD